MDFISPARYPAEANTQIKTKTYEGGLKQFSKAFKNADREYAYEMGEQGEVYQYRVGKKHSVTPDNQRHKGTSLLHNHPSGSNFSGADLRAFANTGYKRVVAVGSKYTYTIERTGHFNKKGFMKMLSTAKASSDDYNKSVHKLLFENASKYGYKYSRTNTKTK